MLGQNIRTEYGSRKSSRLNQRSCEFTNGTSETLHDDTIAHLAHSMSNAFIRRRESVKHNDCCPATKISETAGGRDEIFTWKAIKCACTFLGDSLDLSCDYFFRKSRRQRWNLQNGWCHSVTITHVCSLVIWQVHHVLMIYAISHFCK
jgi:hypothetical protein